MDDQSSFQQAELAAQHRHQALLAFIATGMQSPPSAALAVTALADARRAVAGHQARNQSIDSWLASEVRLRGIRENTAVLAALEIPERREETAESYRREHPDRTTALAKLLASLE